MKRIKIILAILAILSPANSFADDIQVFPPKECDGELKALTWVNDGATNVTCKSSTDLILIALKKCKKGQTLALGDDGKSLECKSINADGGFVLGVQQGLTGCSGDNYAVTEKGIEGCSSGTKVRDISDNLESSVCTKMTASIEKGLPVTNTTTHIAYKKCTSSLTDLTGTNIDYNLSSFSFLLDEGKRGTYPIIIPAEKGYIFVPMVEPRTTFPLSFGDLIRYPTGCKIPNKTTKKCACPEGKSPSLYSSRQSPRNYSGTEESELMFMCQ